MRAPEFFDLVPALFEASKPSWEKGYNELIYSMQRPLTAENVRDVFAWAGDGKAPRLASGDVAQVNDVLARIRWPDVRSLARLKGIEGMTLPRAVALLHFHNPSFPPFQAAAVQGLALLGKRIRRPTRLSLEDLRAYRRHMDAITALKEGIPFRDVPESHYFHSWMLEASLGELAREQA